MGVAVVMDKNEGGEKVDAEEALDGGEPDVLPTS